MKNPLGGIWSSFKKPEQSAWEKGGYHFDVNSNWYQRIEALTKISEAREAVEKKFLDAAELSDEERHKAAMKSAIIDEREFCYKLRMYVLVLADAFYRAVDNEWAWEHAKALKYVYTSYKLAEAHYTVDDEIDTLFNSIRIHRLHLIEQLVSYIETSFSEIDVIAKDIVVIPQFTFPTKNLPGGTGPGMISNQAAAMLDQ